MPRIAPLFAADASADLKAAWAHHIDSYPGSRITNMKATLSHSPLAFDVYMQWYPLYEAVKTLFGDRSAYLFSHAISQASDCPLCTTFFRRLIIENGERPENLQLTKAEAELLAFGAAMASNRGDVSDAVYAPIQQAYADTEVVLLVAFAGQMIATNLFNNVLDVTPDDYLAPYQPLTQPATHA